MDDVINVIKRRYIHERAIYTWCGIALVAVNPYQEQDIYGEQVVETYHSAAHSVYLQLDPHIYAVTEDAYSKLELHAKNQSIIVSGESGAGKTVSAKHAMRYLTSIASSQKKGGKKTVGSVASMLSSSLFGASASASPHGAPTTVTAHQQSASAIEQRVLASNPIMEAIGNARTVRNDNSSRFGKYIQIYFDRHRRRILGAHMRTYLLEKSRVSQLQPGERNYHIFYQMLNYAQRHAQKMAHLDLLEPDGSGAARQFRYLGGSGGGGGGGSLSVELTASVSSSPGVTARDELRRFNEALHTLGIDEQRVQIIYRIIAGILHGGNIRFNVVRDEQEQREQRERQQQQQQRQRDQDDASERTSARANNDSRNRKKNDHEDDDCACQVDQQQDEHFRSCCRLLGLDPDQLSARLTTRLLRTGARDIIEKPNNRRQAEYSRDAMLKFVYECLFSWLVALINVSLDSGAGGEAAAQQDGEQQQGKTNSKTPKSPSTKKSILDQLPQEPQFIGVLDIYGFENFQTNSFEQFCINYANEVLQQQYNQHVFKLEQEEYIREGIDWTFIEYSDNQPVIDVIESRPIGVLNLLDEECRMPRGTDESWCAKLYEQLLPDTKQSTLSKPSNAKTKATPTETTTASERVPFKKPKLNYRASFTVCHYAEDVTYTVSSFLEKNRDSLAEEQCQLLRSSEVLSFILDDPLLAKCPMDEQQKPKMRSSRSTTVGSQFRASLAALIQTLNATEPHYVRCIKPNDEKRAFEFNEKRAIEQLRACGVYETIRISNNGFPARWSYKDFAKRYYVLLYGTQTFRELREQAQHSDVRPICEAICRLAYDELKSPYRHLRTPAEQDYIDTLIERHGNKSSAVYQFGKSKLFFRAGQVSYLERVRSQRLREHCVTIQRHVRGWLARLAYAERLEQYHEQLRREATLASLQEQARLQQEAAEHEAREIAEAEAAAAAAAAAELAERQLQQQQLQTQDSLITADSSELGSSLLGDASNQSSPSSRRDQLARAASRSPLASMYHLVVEMMYTAIQPLIISALLEYEALDQPEPFMSLDSQCSSSSSRAQSPEQQFNERSMDQLIKELDKFYESAKLNQVPEQICLQAFKQIFYLICAHSLNQLLIRRDLCQFRKAMQINFNLSCLVQWCRERYLVQWKEIVEQLDPITQATKLLQTRKSSDDIATIEEVCNKLRPSQIIKILNLYSSSYEEQITTDFIHELEEYLNRVRGLQQRDHEELVAANTGQQVALEQIQQHALAATSDKYPPDSIDDENNNNSGDNYNQNDLLMDTKYFFPFVETNFKK